MNRQEKNPPQTPKVVKGPDASTRDAGTKQPKLDLPKPPVRR